MSKIALMGKYFFDFRCDWIAWGKKINKHVTFYKFWKSVWFFKMELPVQSTRGKMFRKWIHNFNSNITSCIMNNGYASDVFQLYTGVRQGLLLSGLLFVLPIEVFDLITGSIIVWRFTFSILRFRMDLKQMSLNFSAKFQGTVRTDVL